MTLQRIRFLEVRIARFRMKRNDNCSVDFRQRTYGLVGSLKFCRNVSTKSAHLSRKPPPPLRGAKSVPTNGVHSKCSRNGTQYIFFCPVSCEVLANEGSSSRRGCGLKVVWASVYCQTLEQSTQPLTVG